MKLRTFLVGLVMFIAGAIILWVGFRKPIAILGLLLIIIGFVVSFSSFLPGLNGQEDKTIYSTDEL